ncbi:MAG: hypothetical protein KKE39_07135, partial [Bacteroidetes bacterium]|nr:hypothetical protein [Bacteroidota bacterium]
KPNKIFIEAYPFTILLLRYHAVISWFKVSSYSPELSGSDEGRAWRSVTDGMVGFNKQIASLSNSS